MARVINGWGKLKTPQLKQLCTRTTDKLIDLHGFWDQLHTSDSFISWRPRHLNQLADEAANKCMDAGVDFANWSDTLPTPEELRKCRVVGFADGGLRRNTGKAAIGWFIAAINKEGVWRLGDGGSRVDVDSAGSFAVEAWALECLVDNLLCLTHFTNGARDDSWMSEPTGFSLEELVEVRRIA